MLFSLLFSLILTECAEVPLAAAFPAFRSKRGLLVVALANVVTNPAVVYVMRLYHLYGSGAGEIVLLAALEIAAVLTEGPIYRRLTGKTTSALLYSLILNGGSFLLGIAVNVLLKQVIL